MQIILGERYFVRPTHPHEKVQRSAHSYGQFLPNEGQICVVDSFLLSRYNEGSITISSINPVTPKEPIPVSSESEIESTFSESQTTY